MSMRTVLLLDIDGRNIYRNWKICTSEWTLTVKKQCKALLLHYSGDEVFDIYQTFQNTGDESGYNETKTALTKYFKPQVNQEFEIFQFRQMKQMNSETVDDYATCLRQKAEYCGCTDKDRELKSQIIQGCKSAKLRRKALQENLDLQKLLLTARTMEYLLIHRLYKWRVKSRMTLNGNRQTN